MPESPRARSAPNKSSLNTGLDASSASSSSYPANRTAVNAVHSGHPAVWQQKKNPSASVNVALQRWRGLISRLGHDGSSQSGEALHLIVMIGMSFLIHLHLCKFKPEKGITGGFDSHLCVYSIMLLSHRLVRHNIDAAWLERDWSSKNHKTACSMIRAIAIVVCTIDFSYCFVVLWLRYTGLLARSVLLLSMLFVPIWCRDGRPTGPLEELLPATGTVLDNLVSNRAKERDKEREKEKEKSHGNEEKYSAQKDSTMFELIFLRLTGVRWQGSSSAPLMQGVFYHTLFEFIHSILALIVLPFVCFNTNSPDPYLKQSIHFDFWPTFIICVHAVLVCTLSILTLELHQVEEDKNDNILKKITKRSRRFS